MASFGRDESYPGRSYVIYFRFGKMTIIQFMPNFACDVNAPSQSPARARAEARMKVTEKRRVDKFFMVVSGCLRMMNY